MPDPVEIIIRVVNEHAKQGFREAADAGRQAYKDIARAAETAVKGVRDMEERAAIVRRGEIRQEAKELEYLAAMRLKLAAQARSEDQAAADFQKQSQRSFREGNDQRKRELESLRGAILKRYSDEENAMKLNRETNRLIAREQADTKKEMIKNEVQHKDAASDVEKAILNVSTAYTGMRIAAEIQQGIRAAWMGITQSIRESRDMMRDFLKQTEDMVSSRAFGELMALKGLIPTPGAAGRQAGKAAQAGLTVEEYNAAELQFLNFAGQQYIQNVPPGGAEPTSAELAAGGRKISSTMVPSLFQKAATYGVGANRLSPDETMKALGTALAASPAGSSEEDILSLYTKILTLGQTQTGATNPAIGQLAEVGLMRAGPNDPEKLVNVMAMMRPVAQNYPAKAATYMKAYFRGIEQMQGEAQAEREKGNVPRLDELGIAGMTPNQINAQIGKKRLAALAGAKGKGKTPEEAEAEFTRRYFNEEREFGGAIALLSKPEQVQAALSDAAKVNSDTLAKRNTAYSKEYLGQKFADESREKQAIFEAGAEQTTLAQRRRQARLDLLRSKEWQRPEGVMGAMVTQGGAAIGGAEGTRFDQETTAEIGRGIAQDFANLRNQTKGQSREQNELRRQMRVFLYQEMPSAFDVGATMRRWKHLGEDPEMSLYGRETDEAKLMRGSEFIDQLKQQTMLLQKIATAPAVGRAGIGIGDLPSSILSGAIGAPMGRL